MIEVKETLKVSAEAFFDQLVKSVAYDICTSTGKQITEEQIHQGYCYEKKMNSKLGQTRNVKVKITDFTVPVCYGAKFKSVAGTNIIRYTIEPLNEKEIMVTYTEDFKGESKSQDLNYSLMGAFYKRKAKKKTIRRLHDIENYILSEENISC